MIMQNHQKIYLHTAFTHMVFFLPVIIPYYHSIGLSFRDFLIGEAVFSAVVLLAEVPSGWISDVWKRRTTLMLGAIFGMTGFITLMFADDLFTACLAQGIIGIAVALNSGTNTAILYDGLLEEGRITKYRKMDGKRHAFGLYAVAFGCIVGAFAFTIHPKLPLMFDITALFCAMIAVSTVREPVRVTKSVEKNLFHDMAKTIKYALHGHKEVAGIIILSAVIFCATRLMMWSQQPYYQQAGLPVEWFGFILAASYILGGILGQHSHKIEHLGNHKTAIATMAAVLIGACVTLGFGVGVMVAIPLFLTGTIAYACGQPRINAAINGMVGSERRATVLSTASLMVHVLFIPSSLMVGYVSEVTDIHGALFFIAGEITVLGALALFLWGQGRHHITAKEN